MNNQTIHSSQAADASLISPTIDFLCIGGLSIIALILAWLFIGPYVALDSVASAAFTLSFFVNMPHFLASYQLLYGDYRRMIFQKRSFFWAGVISPTVLILVLLYAILLGKVAIMSKMLQVMYFAVGWHYVKQIYGTALFASAIQNRYFGKWEKFFIRFSLYSVWAMSWVNANLESELISTDGISYSTLGLPAWLMPVTYAITIGTFLIALLIGVRKYVLTGNRPAYASLACFATSYIWYIPAWGHLSFFYFIPFFHSLQYLLFVAALKKNQSLQAARSERDPSKQRVIFLKKFLGFFGLTLILAGLLMYWVPKTLDDYFPISKPLMGTTVWFFAFNIFINLHHYFIDNVIWRSENPLLKEYLILKS